MRTQKGRRERTKGARPRPFRPRLEALEDRTLMSVFTVINTNDSGTGSLRQAILDANAHANSSALDEIPFNIPGTGVQTISVAAVLPTITDPVLIDGYTQPGTSPNTLDLGNNAVLLIKLDGHAAGQLKSGLGITAKGCVVRGLIIERFNSDGIQIYGGGGALISGNYIPGNQDDGIEVYSPGNTIGGTAPAARNVIVGGNGSALELFMPALVQGNFIGTTFDGIQGIGRSAISAGAATIGGTTPGARNVIAGSVSVQGAALVQGNYVGVNVTGDTRFDRGSISVLGVGATIGGISSAARNIVTGVYINGTGHLVQGNFLGTNAAGTRSFDRGFGVNIAGGSQNTIGGTVNGAGNLISGNFFAGIRLSTQDLSRPAEANLIQGNLIGTDATGTAAVPNQGSGGTGCAIEVFRSSNNTIGGTTPQAGNIISGNTGCGISIGSTSGTLVQGNRIGLYSSGVQALPNTTDGILLAASATNNTIGGLQSGAGNTIAGNGRHGILLDSGGQDGTIVGNHVQGNSIGYVAGRAVGNAADGIHLGTSVRNNTIGGTTRAAGNVIRSNGGDGIGVSGDAADNRFLSNSIFANNSLGIDLDPGQVTPNDPADTDGGPNGRQNFPTIFSAVTSSFGTMVRGSLNSRPNASFRIEFFVSPRCDASGNGEGQNFLGAENVTTDANGNASFKANYGAVLPVPGVITATATDVAGNTSEFSACVPLITSPSVVTGADAGGGPALRIFTPSGIELARFHAYDPTFTGGVRVTTGDVDGDGFSEIITAPGGGMAPIVNVFTGTALLRSFSAYGSFTGGVFVTAGDIDGDGTDEIITGADAGGGPAVRVFSGQGMELLRFHAYGTTFHGGVRVAAGDTNGDGRTEIITAPGAGGAPNVRVFNGTDGSLIRSFTAYGSFTGGVYVAAGDTNGDGRDDIITGAGAGGAPLVKIFDSANPNSAPRSFLAYASSFQGGVRVAAIDVNGDGRADIITGPGPRGKPLVKTFNGITLALIDDFFAYNETFTGGVFVAGG